MTQLKFLQKGKSPKSKKKIEKKNEEIKNKNKKKEKQNGDFGLKKKMRYTVLEVAFPTTDDGSCSKFFNAPLAFPLARDSNHLPKRINRINMALVSKKTVAPVPRTPSNASNE